MRKARGFTLIEVLVVVAIIGILASLGIWNYYLAIQRSRQKRTMADIRAIAEAWESRAVDTRAYNAAGFTVPATPITFSDLSTLIVPTYIRVLPRVDGWGNPYDFSMDQPIGGLQAKVYAIRSAGRDGAFDSNSYTPGPTTNFDCDIVYSAGGFVTWPEGNQGAR